MSTPEPNLPPKNYITTKISKHLLTPCRRVGLSRLKQTPKKNTLDIFGVKNDNTTSCDGPSLDVTPKPKRNTGIKKETFSTSSNYDKVPKGLDCVPEIQIPLKKSEKLETFKKTDNLEINIENTPIKEFGQENTKKSLKNKITKSIKSTTKNNSKETHKIKEERDNFQISNEEKKLPNEHDSPPKSPIISLVEAEIHHPSAKRCNNFNENEKKDDKRGSNNSISMQVQDLKICLSNEDLQAKLSKGKKRKLRLDSSDFEDIENESGKSQVTKNNKLKRFNTNDYLEAYLDNSKALKKDMEQLETFNYEQDDDDDFTPEIKMTIKSKNKTPEEKKKKKYVAIVCSSVEQSTSALKNDKNIKLDKRKNENPKQILPKRIFTNDDSEDEMFTSSPDNDRKQHENLLKLVLDLENEIKQKEDILDRLKQADIYKKIHNKEKLQQSSEVWLEGCRKGLKDLLVKMQEHGPIDMNMLIKNLKIPDEIVEKLKMV